MTRLACGGSHCSNDSLIGREPSLTARQGDNYVTHIISWNPSQHPFSIDPEIPYFTDSRIKQREWVTCLWSHLRGSAAQTQSQASEVIFWVVGQWVISKEWFSWILPLWPSSLARLTDSYSASAASSWLTVLLVGLRVVVRALAKVSLVGVTGRIHGHDECGPSK